MERLTRLETSIVGVPAFTVSVRRVRNKTRAIAHPNEAMYRLHALLLQRLASIPYPDTFFAHAYGVNKGKSAIQNAVEHAWNRYVYQLDIQDAYRNTPLARLAEVLVVLDPSLGSKDEVAAFLCVRCSVDGKGLAVGAPASPALFNIYCASAIDAKLVSGLTQGWTTTFTRYLDDLTVSSNDPIPSILRRRIRDVVRAAGYEVNRNKSRLSDRTKERVVITGVVVERDSSIRPTDEYLKKITATLRKPTSTFSVADAYGFQGDAAYLTSFSSEGGLLVSSTVMQLGIRCRSKVAALVHAGLLPERSTRKHLYPEWFIEELRTLVPVEEMARRYVKRLKQRGKEFVALSPFTKERTPSFTITPAKGLYHDFSSGKSGDLFTLVMEMERCTFPEAVRFIAKEYLIPLP